MNVLAYLDESGTHASAPAIAVGGLIAPAANWGAFAFEWTSALEEWRLESFHMADFENRRPGYDWPEDVRRARLNRVLAMISSHVTGSVGITFSRADYDVAFPVDEIPDPPRPQEIAPGVLAPWASRPGDMEPADVEYRPGELRRKTGGPYGLAAAALLIDVGEIAKSLPGEPYVDYVFEDGADGRGQLWKVVQGVIDKEGARRDSRVSSITFRSKATPGLQAADIVAYELGKQLSRDLGLEDRPVRYPLRELARLPRKWGKLDLEELRKWRWILGIGLHHGEGRWNR